MARAFRKTRGGRILTWIGGLLVVGLVGVLTAVWILGPTMGVMVTGKPVFLLPPSPQRYATAVFDIAERQGMYASSQEFVAARTRAEEEIRSATSVSDTYVHIDAVLKAAGGKHSTLLVPGSVAAERGEGQLPTVDADGSVVSVKLPATDVNWDGQEYVDAAAVPLVEAVGAGACAAIVDLRGNTGGDMGPMVAGISPLLPEGEVLWFSTPAYDTAVTVTGNSVHGGGSTTTASVDTKLTVPVAMLVDDSTASSGEATMLTFRGLEHSRSFGVPTAGYASANISFAMPDGARILLTTANDKARTGEVFGDDPVQPDVLTGSAERDARAWIAQQGCGV